jgi:hypothetical protein
MLSVLLLTVIGSLVGAFAAVLVACWFFFRHLPTSPVHTEPPDPFTCAEIDQAAARWASDQGRPEAAGVMADKLHLLYALQRRRSQP